MTISLIFSACTPYTAYIMPQIPVPDDFKQPTRQKLKDVDLSDKHVAEVSRQLNANDQKFLKALLYNYYDNSYGVKICNTKLSTVAGFIDFYNDIALQGWFMSYLGVHYKSMSIACRERSIDLKVRTVWHEEQLYRLVLFAT